MRGRPELISRERWSSGVSAIKTPGRFFPNVTRGRGIHITGRNSTDLELEHLRVAEYSIFSGFLTKQQSGSARESSQDQANGEALQQAVLAEVSQSYLT